MPGVAQRPILGEINKVFDTAAMRTMNRLLVRAGEAITSGLHVVGLSGTIHSQPAIKMAQPGDEKLTRQIYFCGMAAALNDEVEVFDIAPVRLDTSAAVVGDPVYLAANGAITLTAPAGYRPTVVGFVQKADTVANGGWAMLDSNAPLLNSQPTPSGGVVMDTVTTKIEITAGTTGSPYSAVVPDGYGSKLRLIRAWTYCTATDASGKAQLTNTGGTAITNQMTCDTAAGVSDASSIASATREQNAGATVKVAYTGGSAAGRGFVYCIWEIVK